LIHIAITAEAFDAVSASVFRRIAKCGTVSGSKEDVMAKAYWISTYRSISNPEALAAYAKLAGPALTAAGG